MVMTTLTFFFTTYMTEKKYIKNNYFKIKVVTDKTRLKMFILIRK